MRSCPRKKKRNKNNLIMNRNSSIGVFDSGVGGISVLRDMVKLLPEEKFIYYGDNKNAPYGTRSEEEIRTLAVASANVLLSYNIKALVIACNTATSAAAACLREKLTIPVVGMEPALKPASLSWHGGRILVLATPATLRQQKFRLLNEKYGEHAVIHPCPGLMDLVEEGDMHSEKLKNYIRGILDEYKGEQLDGIVLGCTHYVFLKPLFRESAPQIPLFDGNDGTARRLRYLLEEGNMRSASGSGGVEFLTSGDGNVFIPRMKQLFELPTE